MFDEARTAESAEVSARKLRESRLAGREHRKQVRRAEYGRWQQSCRALEEAERKNDTHAFWRELKRLGLYGAPVVMSVNFSEVELRSHFSKIGKEINSIEERVLETLPVGTPNEDLGTSPLESEILDALEGMTEILDVSERGAGIEQTVGEGGPGNVGEGPNRLG